jgi:hypothetical protein
VYNLMRYGVAYMKKDEAAYAEHVRERLEKQFRRRAKELGFAVTRIEPEAKSQTDESAVAVLNT